MLKNIEDKVDNIKKPPFIKCCFLVLYIKIKKIMNYTTTEKFNKSLTQGMLGEKIMSCYMNVLYGLKDIKFNDSDDLKTLRKYDFGGYINGVWTTYEVKTDLYEYHKNIKTDNMFIEFKCNGKVSGIRASKADYLLYYYPIHEIVYIMKKNVLIDYLDKNWKTHISTGGDSKVAIGYLVNRYDVEASGLFKIINNIPKEIYKI